ncbi:MAG: T9SS type A sorting domain-containing protein [Bacteroidales bacterium]|nr:T9SS type A sorting domain-containing protein [Bacteroidales bacterium]
MKKKSLLLVLLTIVIRLSCNAQVFEQIYQNDKYKINELKLENHEMINVINNYDDQGLYIQYINFNKDSSLNYLFDDELNVVEVDKFSVLFGVDYKLNNKMYSFSTSFIGNYDYYENLFMYRRDSLGSLISRDTLIHFQGDTIKWAGLMLRSIMLDDKNFIVLLSSKNSEFAKLIKVDTMANILYEKTFYHQNFDLDLCEMKDNLLFAINGAPSVTRFKDDCSLYYLNKETFEIEDSIKGYYPANMTRINDSILVFTFFFGQDIIGQTGDSVSSINLFNVNSKSLINVEPVLIEGVEDDIFIDFYGTETKRIIDFVNTDSIYICYYASNWDWSYGALELRNFNLNGDTNFVYRISFQDSSFKNIRGGIKATQDGGVIIAAYSSQSGFSRPYNAWLIKFNPKGLISLTNIETGDKESIKVYPNPAKDYIYVDIEASNFKQSDIELFDMQGRLIKKEKLKSKLGNRINVSNLNAGAYTYNVSVNGKTISGKVIIGN